MIGLLILENKNGRPYVVLREEENRLHAVSLDDKRLPLVLFRDERGRIKGVGRLFTILGRSEYLAKSVRAS